MHRNLGAVPFDMATEAQRVKVVYTYLNGKIYVGLQRRYRASHGWPASRSRLGSPLRPPDRSGSHAAGCGDTAIQPGRSILCGAVIVVLLSEIFGRTSNKITRWPPHITTPRSKQR